MAFFLFTFSHKGFTVTYKIMARSHHRANSIAKDRERMWRLAVDDYLKEHASWS